MTEQGPQKNAMDVLQAFVDDYNARARPAIRLGSAGEAGGAQLRLRYSPADGQVSIFHMGAGSRDGRATMLVGGVEGPTPGAAVQAGAGGGGRRGGGRRACRRVGTAGGAWGRG